MAFGTVKDDITVMDGLLGASLNYDVIKRELTIGGKEAVLYMIDGFCKEAVAQKIVESLMKVEPGEMKKITEEAFLKEKIPYTEVITTPSREQTALEILSGQMALLVDGFSVAYLIDTRQYPSRSIAEPDKDRSLRGSRDSFCETLVNNTALIRRRIRDFRLRTEHFQVGSKTKLDVVICYLDGVASRKELGVLKKRIGEIKVDAIGMTSEALSELLVPTSFFNPLPRI